MEFSKHAKSATTSSSVVVFQANQNWVALSGYSAAHNRPVLRCSRLKRYKL